MLALFPSEISAPQFSNKAPKVVVVYDDRVAGERAMRLLTQLKSQAPTGTTLCPAPWNFEFLGDLRWRTRALDDVNAADILIFSISEPDETPASINHWIATCLKQKRGAPAHVFLLLDSENVWSLVLGADEEADAPLSECVA